jgi:ubiquinone/menaquinone biosynthesis C-methylase UbiE
LGIDLGIDPARRLLALAQGRGVNAIYGRGEALPLRDGSFGAAFLIVTLCFVEDPEAVLRECHRVLKPEGQLVVGLVPREGP